MKFIKCFKCNNNGANTNVCRCDESIPVVTCVYCGQAYENGTPTYGAKVLTDHIKICEKHPLREAEEKITKLYTALVGLVGETDKEKLKEMRSWINRIDPYERKSLIYAIDILLEMEIN